ncbi:hypothetical protein H5P28_01205 [Ruficoccus amylovorans]|uniref:Uncharacterized protein n=1 Tax=Ruficoccus amylovorans TaxID=1804625 RepID=A0A842HB60_9BACT|nr:hypothetical protein [Ruficoccus amylovorans]MBC2592867.1 hypothetical protein [Ruficoccus amylovorans]
MSTTTMRITSEALALPEDERLQVFLQLASSLPNEKAQLAESARRAREMSSGKVVPMTEEEFGGKMNALKEQFRKQA